MSGLALTDSGPIGGEPTRCNVFDLDAYNVTPPQLAVDREIEECEIACLAVHLELGADRPHVFGLQRWSGADDFPLVPRNLSRRGTSFDECCMAYLLLWEVKQLARRLLLDQTTHSDGELVEDNGAL
jgi:hypothetical protein